MADEMGPLKPRTGGESEAGILALVPERWNLRWMSRHQFLTRLSWYFPVVWVNPAEAWRDVLLEKPKTSFKEYQSLPRFIIYDSRVLPKFYRPKMLGAWFERKRLQEARNLLIRQGCKKIVLYLWRPEFEAALRTVPHDLSCYHIVDEYSFSEKELPISEEERSVITEVDQVFVCSPGLLEKKGGLNPHTTLVPNGVDYERFSSAVSEPSDLAGVPHPRIGYMGYLKKMLDWRLLNYLSLQHPSWSLVLVGAALNQPDVEKGLRELRTRPNVHILGPKLTREFPNYPQHFDVCIMPYRVTDYTKYIYPLKLQEYLASGRPVVGTHIRTLEDYSRVVSMASTLDEWSAAITKALEPDENQLEKRAERQATARLHDWDVLTQRIAQVLSERLGVGCPEGPPEGNSDIIYNSFDEPVKS